MQFPEEHFATSELFLKQRKKTKKRKQKVDNKMREKKKKKRENVANHTCVIVVVEGEGGVARKNFLPFFLIDICLQCQ